MGVSPWISSLPLVILLSELYFFPRQTRQNKTVIAFVLVVSVMAMLIPALILLQRNDVLIRTFASRSHIGDTITSQSYLLTQFRVILTYIRFFFFPVHQVFEYDFTVSSSLFEWTTFSGLLFLLGWVALAVWLFRRNALVSYGIFWFFITMAVESSIIPIRYVIFEHRMYLPLAGCAMAFSSGLCRLLPDRRTYHIGMVVVVILLGVLTIIEKLYLAGPSAVLAG